MVVMNGHLPVPHHRQNRRRERPGSRTRRTVVRKVNFQHDLSECLLDANDSALSFPSHYYHDKSNASPLLRQNFDQSWQRWKARQAEEKALAEMDKLQMIEQEQLRLFGGDVGDDELFRLGILYNDEHIATDSEPNNVVCDVPAQPYPFIVRHARKPRRALRRSRWQGLPLHLSFSGLSKDPDILRLLSLSPNLTPPIQHRLQPQALDIDIPQSLPTSALELHSPGSSYFPTISYTISNNNDNDTPSSPTTPSEDWTFIPHLTTTITHDSSPSNPDPWILIDDS